MKTYRKGKMETKIKAHEWGSLTATEIEVLADDRGQPVVFKVGEPEERIGCVNCDASLNKSTFATECLETPWH